MTREDIRNIAIIAHVDHGKTTLVDQLLKQNGVFREGEAVADRVMDSNALERERGITILAKNTAVHYNGIKINIIDTPGHADFGGEVERILSMVDGVLLLVDAVEGCMPQTRYVLKKALGLNKKPVVVINKVDRGCDHEKIIDEVLELFLELGANDDQIDFKVVYASAKLGWATLEPGTVGKDMRPLLDMIVSEIPAPEGDDTDGLQAIICNVDYDDYVGRIGIGKIVRGSIRSGQLAALCHTDGTVTHEKVVKLYQFEGLRRVEADRGTVGDIIALSGIQDLNIGETICDVDKPDPLPFVAIDEPTLSMTFMVNDSPFAGKEGKFVTSRHLRARLFREVMTNVSMRARQGDGHDRGVRGVRQRRIASVHFDRDDAPRGLRVSSVASARHFQGDRRSKVRTDRDRRRRRPRRIRRRGHEQTRRAQGRTRRHDSRRQRGHAPHLLHPGALPYRLSRRDADRHTRIRRDDQRVQGL